MPGHFGARPPPFYRGYSAEDDFNIYHSRQTSVSLSGGRRGTRHMVGSLRVSGAADAGGAYVMVMEGAKKEAVRLWDKFGMKDV